MKVLITGGSGTIGSAVFNEFHKNNHENTTSVLRPSRAELDITNLAACIAFVKKHEPDVIIHCAALTDLNHCENNPSEALRCNTEGAVNLLYSCAPIDSHFVYISTHAVFGQSSDSLREDTMPSLPLNTYALSKLFAEQYIKALLPESRSLILRLGWSVSDDLDEDKKFLGVMYRQIKSRLTDLEVVDDTYGSITYIPEAVELIVRSAIHKHSGTHHLANRGAVTRFELLSRFVEAASIDSVRLQAVSSSKFKSVNLAPYSVLVEEHEDMMMMPWHDAIDLLGAKYRGAIA